jgi:NAD(P)-dependent dehydrogenase (short-subunit alcohol dehydrogenase family)
MSEAVIGEGRVAVVTGAASGIGKALAEALVRAGSSVVMADVEANALDGAAAELRALGGDVEAVVTDVSDLSSVEALAAATIARFGHVDLLCNNAGVSTFNLITDQTLADWKWVFDVNLWGVVYGIHTFLPIMREQGTPAHIVSTSSLGGLMSGVQFIAPYAATKVAVVSISETLRDEMGTLGLPIGVSVLCPGSTDTKVMESERVRPSSLGQEHRSEMAEMMRQYIKDSFTGPAGHTPAAVAEQVLAAIRADEFWIITSPFEKPIVEARFTDILAHFPELPAPE